MRSKPDANAARGTPGHATGAPVSAPPVPSPLLHEGWSYVTPTALDEFRAADWALLDAQRAPYYAEQQASQVLRMLAVSRDDASFGYGVNNYRHCLQAATLVLRDGLDEETVVVALLHDIGFTVCPSSHGEFAAALLGPHVSAANHWMLCHHAVFQQFHCHQHPRAEREARERWRGHPHFDWTARFVERYDQNAIDPAFVEAPLEVFEPLVRRLFARAPQPFPVEEPHT